LYEIQEKWDAASDDLELDGLTLGWHESLPAVFRGGWRYFDTSILKPHNYDNVGGVFFANLREYDNANLRTFVALFKAFF